MKIGMKTNSGAGMEVTQIVRGKTETSLMLQEDMMDMRKILLVDDDEDFVLATTLILENNGYQVVSALDGPDGLIKSRDKEPDLILLDVMMAKISEGFGVLGELRREPKTSKIPVIMLSAIESHFPDTVFDIEQLSADLFLDKPVKPGKLLFEIENLLAR